MPRGTWAVIVVLVCATACSRESRGTPRVPPAELIVVPSNVTLKAGETVQLAVQVNDLAGRPIGEAPITYHVDAASLVRVSSLGLVSAVGRAGKDSVVVRSDSLRRVVPVLVIAGQPSVIDVGDAVARTGVVGRVVSGPVAVTVRDAFGNRVARTAVQFTPEFGGSTSPASTVTDATGQARTLWTLGPLAGLQTLRVRADSTQASLDASAQPGTMAQVIEIDAVPRRAQAADSMTVRLRVADQFGNGLAGVVFAFRVEAGGGDVTPARMESDINGTVATVWRSGERSGVNTMRVRVIQQRDTSLLISRTTVGGLPTSLTLVAGDRQRATGSSPVQRAPEVRVTDRYGNPVAAVRVRFVVSPASGASGGSVEPSEVVTDDAGKASPRVWRLGPSGPQELQVVADGIADTVRIRATATKR